MRTFMYTIKSPVGLHARHAGLLVRETSRFQSEITVSLGEKTANGKGILSLMGLGVKQGDVITMAAGCRHTVIAGSQGLQMIEVQLGRDISVSDKKKYDMPY